MGFADFFGFGGAKTKTTLTGFNTNVQRTVNTSITNIARASQGVITGTQVIHISGISAGGDLTISNIKQKQVAKIDFSRAISVINKDTLRNIMENAIKVAETNDQNVKTALFGGNALATSDTTIHNTNVNEVMNSYTYNDFTNDMQQVTGAQTIDISSLSALGNVTIENLSQYLSLEIVSQNIADHMTEKLAEIMQKNETDIEKENKQDAEASGLDIAALTDIFGFRSMLMIAFVFVALIVFVILIFVLKSSMGGKS